MTDRHRRVRLQEQLRGGLADDRASPDDDGPGTFELDRVLGKQRDHPDGGRWHEPRPAEVELAGVFRMESIDVLRRIDGVRDPVVVDMAWQRQLHEQRIDRVVGIQVTRPPPAGRPR